MRNFQEWRNEGSLPGLGDFRVQDPGSPKGLKNRLLPKKGMIPRNVPDYKFSNSPGSNPPSFAERRDYRNFDAIKVRRKVIPTFSGGDNVANTRLDPGGDHRG